MVCDWGMSALGPLAFGKKEEAIFLGREIAQHRTIPKTGDSYRPGSPRHS